LQQAAKEKGVFSLFYWGGNLNKLVKKEKTKKHSKNLTSDIFIDFGLERYSYAKRFFEI